MQEVPEEMGEAHSAAVHLLIGEEGASDFNLCPPYCLCPLN